MSEANVKEINAAEVDPTESGEAVQMATMPLETLNKVLNALAAMPYAQVAELMQEVQQNVKAQ